MLAAEGSACERTCGAPVGDRATLGNCPRVTVTGRDRLDTCACPAGPTRSSTNFIGVT